VIDDQVFWYSVNNLINLLENNNSSAFKAEVNNSGLCAKGAAPAIGFYDNSETIEVLASVPLSLNK
jgi:hypothetical protein